MAKYRQIHLSFWQDPYVEELKPLEKFFYLYLMTNSKTTQCGCYEISNRLMEYETGLTTNTILDFVVKLSDAKKVCFNPSTGEFLLLNWLKHNSFKSPKVKACILGELENIKYTPYKDYINSILSGNTTMDSLSIVYTESMHTGSQEEQEQKEEQEQEKLIVQKEEEIKTSAKDIDLFFEKIWKQYPLKKGKASISKTKKADLYKLGEELERAIKRYTEYVNANDWLKYQNGSTFFNSGYVDYLDANYTKETEKPKKPTNNKFINHEQHAYDFDDIESKMDALLDEKFGE